MTLSMSVGGVKIGFVGHLQGEEVFTSFSAVESEVTLRFPESKHRSRRIRKKLIKRFGPQYYQKPAIFKLAGKGFVMHPEMWEKLSAEIKKQEIVRGWNPYGMRDVHHIQIGN